MNIRIFILFIFLLICLNKCEKISYRDNQLWKIYIDNNDDFKFIHKLEDDNYLTIWNTNQTTIDVIIAPTKIEETKQQLQNFTYAISLLDIQEAIDLENPTNSSDDEELDNRRGHRLTWDSYHTLEDIYGYLHYLAETYPKLCTIETIGYSAENRPIKLLKISNGNPNNTAIWMDGGIHAREWITPASATYIIEQIIFSYEYEIGATSKLIDWFIVPVLNPDGYVYTYTVDRLWRKNRRNYGKCYGVDLNRNFGFDWGLPGASNDPCKPTFKGTSPFSEPETSAVAGFFLQNIYNRRWGAFLSLHSYGQMILYPWGSTTQMVEDDADLRYVGLQAAKEIYKNSGVNYVVGPASTTIYLASGTSIDWGRGILNIKYSYTIELRDRGENYGFLLPANMIKTTANDALIFVRTVVNAVINHA